jgi:D-amino-acid dehydrogenase
LHFSHVCNGKLIAYRSAELLEKARGLAAYQAGYGTEQKILSAAETVAIEPALAAMGNQLAGAVYTPSEETGDCRQFTEALFQRLQALPGTRICMGTSVTGLRRRGSRVSAVATDHGDIEADAFVVAAGMGSRALLQPLGQDVPVYPLKGYSLSVPLKGVEETAPSISVTDYERRIVYARVGDVLRIAAMVDIGAADSGIDADRIALLKRQVGQAFPQLDLSKATPWAGQRPATPDGKPRIGRSRAAENLWLNLGQGALGFTLACGSAALLTAQMAGLPTPIDDAPFRPE